MATGTSCRSKHRYGAWASDERQSLYPAPCHVHRLPARAGDKIPADVRFIWCASAKVDNSSLTGESVPLVRKAKATTDNSRDAENMGFFGTTLITGSAYGVVVRTGDRYAYANRRPPRFFSLSSLEYRRR